ncbi:SaoD/DsrE family protein [Thermus sp.]|uniref:SaoD/DsrE family protein n=1 Tax=Thermus sp. TaxID=275 RepID=UPI00307E9AF7
MKVLYVLSSPRAASRKLGGMILPQLEAGVHGAEPVGFFLFDDNVLILQKGNPIGERLMALARAQGFFVMACDACALERGLARGEPRWCTPEGEGKKVLTAPELLPHVLEGVELGCFPDLYARLAAHPPQAVVTL